MAITSKWNQIIESRVRKYSGETKDKARQMFKSLLNNQPDPVKGASIQDILIKLNTQKQSQTSTIVNKPVKVNTTPISTTLYSTDNCLTWTKDNNEGAHIRKEFNKDGTLYRTVHRNDHQQVFLIEYPDNTTEKTDFMTVKVLDDGYEGTGNKLDIHLITKETKRDGSYELASYDDNYNRVMIKAFTKTKKLTGTIINTYEKRINKEEEPKTGDPYEIISYDLVKVDYLDKYDKTLATIDKWFNTNGELLKELPKGLNKLTNRYKSNFTLA